MYHSLSIQHDWPVRKAIVDLPGWGNSKCTSANLLSLLRVQNRDIDLGVATWTLVSSCNGTTGRRGRQNACTWQMRQAYYVRVLLWSSPNINVFWSLQKDLFKGEWSLAKGYFKQNYCHACYTRFAVFFPPPSCCVSSLLLTRVELHPWHRLMGVNMLKGTSTSTKR